ncbi:MAG: class I SAM-dependent methyltransferase [Candidatus Njordarchaeales archaeon]
MLSAVFPVENLRPAEQILMNERLIHPLYKPVFLEKQVFFPLKDRPTSDLLPVIKRWGGRIEKVEDKFFPRKIKTRSLKELEKIHGMAFPKSVSIVGDLLLINEIPEESYEKKQVLGEILRENFSVRAVFLKVREVAGLERVAEWERIAGFGDTFTVHKENGFYYALDVSKVFFNPRMGNERARVIKVSKGNELVIDMFSGVGPFSIPLAARCAQVFAIDINPKAVEYLRLNLLINRISERKLVPILGDSRQEVPKLNVKADRIIMNYPEKAVEFLDVAISALKSSGGYIHIYLFECGDNKKEVKKASKLFLARILSGYSKRFKITFIHVIKEVAPRKYMLVADIFAIPRTNAL